ncbi:hypothetical protein BDN72DRAFT_785370 [Pluteus cervinus]|uniref:Uncharacterized protein n=1 Tax=Pluteus cervinus TaxID=181527 RepID=A0ACD3BFV4_9AGAR|nr:hypothetical protein BDN72DRAFT_785370 [Pluteus cervinus]
MLQPSSSFQIPNWPSGHIASVVGLSVVTFAGASVFVLRKWWQAKTTLLLSQTESATLSQTLERHKKELETLQSTVTALRLEVQRKEDTLRASQGELGRAQRQTETLEGELRASRNANEDLNRRLKVQEADNMALRRRSEQLEDQYRQTSDLLAIRTTELKAAHTFLNKADDYSGADIISMLEALNDEILQTAALVADTFKIERKEDSWSPEDPVLKASSERVSEILGPNFVDLLVHTEHCDDPIIPQMAFQAGMCAYADWMISSWYFENTRDEQLLSEIYNKVRKSEEQAVSGRWRALTHIYAQRATSDEPNFVSLFVEFFAHILITAGYKGDPASLQEAVLNSFQARLTDVALSTRRLNQAIGEGVTSCDLEVSYILPSSDFDPTCMEDAYAGHTDADGAPSEEKTLCTTDLGLNRIEKLQGSDGQSKETCLLKPKVVLLSSF